MPDPDPAAAEYLRRLHDLESLGHRGSATPHEHRAADYLLAELRSAGLDPRKTPFRGARSLPARLLSNLAPAAIAAALLPTHPVVAALLTAGSLASLLLEQMTRGIWLSRPVTRALSYNVTARIPSPRPPRRRIVLAAHYDTQPAGWVWAINRRLAPLSLHVPLPLKPPGTPLAFLMLIELGTAALHAMVPLPRLVPLAVAGLLLLVYAVLAVLLIQWALGRPVPGAADNASGVAAVLELAEAWRAHPPADDVELLLLFPGCEESGLLGAAAFADANRTDLRALPTVILNLDALGLGPPRFLGAEVPVAGLPLRAPRWLLDLCARLAAEHHLHDPGPHAIPGPTDGLAFLDRGLAAVTLIGYRDDHRLPYYHTKDDTTANLDLPSARAGVRFAQALLHHLATHPDPIGDVATPRPS